MTDDPDLQRAIAALEALGDPLPLADWRAGQYDVEEVCLMLKYVVYADPYNSVDEELEVGSLLMDLWASGDPKAMEAVRCICRIKNMNMLPPEEWK